MQIPAVVRPFARAVRWRVQHAQMWLHHRLRLYQSSKRLADDAQAYWTGRPGEDLAGDQFHLRGDGPFQDDAVWLELGRAHFELFTEFARMLSFPHPVSRTLEWGVGGGANAVHFARDCGEFVGVDVSQAALDECAVQLQGEGLSNFVPVLVDVDDYSAADRFAGTCDLVLCLYVVEVLPTPRHGAALLGTFRDLLRPGGMALVQMKYETLDLATRSRPWGYATHPSAMTTFPIDGFWKLVERVGLTPRALVLRPEAPEVHDERYAYYAILKDPAPE